MSEAVADVHSRLSCEHVASSFFGLIPRGGALQLPALMPPHQPSIVIFVLFFLLWPF